MKVDGGVMVMTLLEGKLDYPLPTFYGESVEICDGVVKLINVKRHGDKALGDEEDIIFEHDFYLFPLTELVQIISMPEEEKKKFGY